MKMWDICHHFFLGQINLFLDFIFEKSSLMSWKSISFVKWLGNVRYIDIYTLDMRVNLLSVPNEEASCEFAGNLPTHEDLGHGLQYLTIDAITQYSIE